LKTKKKKPENIGFKIIIRENLMNILVKNIIERCAPWRPVGLARSALIACNQEQMRLASTGRLLYTASLSYDAGRSQTLASRHSNVGVVFSSFKAFISSTNPDFEHQESDSPSPPRRYESNFTNKSRYQRDQEGQRYRRDQEGYQEGQRYRRDEEGYQEGQRYRRDQEGYQEGQRYRRDQEGYQEVQRYRRDQEGQRYQRDFNKFRGNNNYGEKRERFSTLLERDKSVREDDQDFEGAEPIESLGQEIDYKVKLTSDFSKYGLSDKLLARLAELGFKKPFEIQDATLEHTLAGK
jgi:hypothetical protein